MHTDLSAKYQLFLADFHQTWTISPDFRKIHKFQILWNPSSGSRVVVTSYISSDGPNCNSSSYVTFYGF